MKKILVAGIAIVLLGIQCAACAGFSVSYTFVDPSGNLTDGTPVTVTCGIPRAGVLLYDQLVFATDLDDPVWEPMVVARGQETPVKPAATTGDSVTINGAVFNYPSPVQAELMMTVKGTVPYNHTTGQRLLSVKQIDADGFEYASPTGYTLPMPGAPSKNNPLTNLTAHATPAIIQVHTSTIPETPAPGPADTLSNGTVPAVKKIVVARTLRPDTTPAPAAPARPLAACAAAGIALFIVRKYSGK